MNFKVGETICYQSFQPEKQVLTTSSLPLTKQSELELQEDKQSYSLTAMNSLISTQHFSFPMGSRQDPLDNKEMAIIEPGLHLQASVTDSTA